MKTFRNNNNRRFRFRNNDRNYKRNGDGKKFNSDFSSPSSFQRKVPGRNNHNAPKLIEKYNDLAREALSKGDKKEARKFLNQEQLDYLDKVTEADRKRLLRDKAEAVSEYYSNRAKWQSDNMERLASRIFDKKNPVKLGDIKNALIKQEITSSQYKALVSLFDAKSAKDRLFRCFH